MADEDEETEDEYEQENGGERRTKRVETLERKKEEEWERVKEEGVG